MYDSRPRPVEGEPIEEVLPSAINATATSERRASEKQSKAPELVRRHSAVAGEEPRMRVMHAGSPALSIPNLSGSVVVVAAAALVLALIVLAVILI